MVEPKGRQAHQQLCNDLAALYATIGLMVTSFDTYDGLILVQKSVERAREVVNVAKHHPPMLKFLKQMVKSNDYITAITGHGLMAYALLAHHGRVPANMVLLQQTGYADIPIAQQQAEQLFEEAVPTEEEYAQRVDRDIIAEQQAYAAAYQDQVSPLHYTVPDPRLGAYAVETPVGGDGQSRP